MQKRLDVLEFYMNNSWKFDTENVYSLYNSLSNEDKIKFPFTMDFFDWQKYAEHYALGVRRYIMLDSDLTISAAQKRLILVKLRTYGYKILMYSCVLGLVVIFCVLCALAYKGVEYILLLQK